MIMPKPADGRLTAVLDGVVDALGLKPCRIITLKDIPLQNGSWLLEMADRRRVVLRRYHALATLPDLCYEHEVLGYLARAGWIVPEPTDDLVHHEGFWYCQTPYVPGAPVSHETGAQRRRRGTDLASLNLALRDLGGQIGQRPGWRAQHTGVTVHTSIDWDAGVRGLMEVSPEARLLGLCRGSTGARRSPRHRRRRTTGDRRSRGLP